MTKNEQDLEEQKRLFLERLKAEIEKNSKEAKKPKESTFDILLNAAFALMVSLVVMFVMAAFNGWALSLLWFWFVAYPFKVQAISMAHAYGLVLLGNFLKNGLAKEAAPQNSHDDPNGIKSGFSVIFSHIFSVCILLAVAWITFTLFIV